MSCQIKGIANIPDINNVKKLLYGDAIGKCKFYLIQYVKCNIY